MAENMNEHFPTNVFLVRTEEGQWEECYFVKVVVSKCGHLRGEVLICNNASKKKNLAIPAWYTIHPWIFPCG